MSENTPELTPEAAADASTDAPPADDSPETAQGESEPDDDGRTFNYDYVKGLREEAKSWRIKAARADELQARLHSELTKADGRLADPPICRSTPSTWPTRRSTPTPSPSC